MISWYTISRSLLLSSCLLSFLVGQAQDSSISPYSRFGLGDLNSGGFVAQSALSGSGVAFIENTQVNPLNPVSAAYMNSPGFQFGVLSEHGTFSSDEQTANNSLTRFDHFAVGIPLRKGRWGASFGLYPYTTIGYTSKSETVVSDSIPQTSEYLGEGGLNKMFLDIGKRLVVIKDTSKYAQHTELALGMELSYLFGSIRSIRNSLFPGQPGFFNARLSNTTTVNDVGLGGGLLFRHPLKKRSVKDPTSVILNFGSKFETGGRYRAEQSQDYFTFVQNASGLESARDSVTSFIGRSGEVDIPYTWRIGTSMEFFHRQREGNSLRRWVVGLDYVLRPWGDLSTSFDSGLSLSGLADGSTLSIGGVYQPDAEYRRGSRGNILNMATYRAGAYLGDSFLAPAGQTLDESGMSFGMSIPLLVGGLRRSETNLDWSVSYHNRGSQSDGLIEERFLRVMIGFSFHPERFDRWFQKRKYD